VQILVTFKMVDTGEEKQEVFDTESWLWEGRLRQQSW